MRNTQGRGKRQRKLRKLRRRKARACRKIYILRPRDSVIWNSIHQHWVVDNIRGGSLQHKKEKTAEDAARNAFRCSASEGTPCPMCEAGVQVRELQHTRLPDGSVLAHRSPADG